LADRTAAAFKNTDPLIAEPQPAQRPNGPASPELLRRPGVQPPASPAAALLFGMPEAGPAHGDFICQRHAMPPARRLEWRKSPAVIHPPKFVVRPLFERIDEVAVPPKLVQKTPAFAEIFTISRPPRRYSSNSSLGAAGKAIAASLLVGIGLWFGAGSVKIGRQLVAINTSFPGTGNSSTPTSSYSYESPGSSSFPSARYSAPQSPSGPVATVRRAIQQRAALELTDTFKRLEVWHQAGSALPAGWSRNADGYVRTGQLAVYQPTKTFSDYHFEFFGQIEKKSLSWAVRAQNAQNYYAMKFTVVEPGLRPVIAMVHYPVLGGKKGRAVKMPLDVMVHNDVPFHVAVDVKGNRVVTSIEGQEVDSWTDDTLKAGGVGFFSDAGESARLYWIRVTKNQDWLGRVCAYLSGGTVATSAELWREETPTAPWQPRQPALPANSEVAFSAAETEEFSEVGSYRAGILKYGRTELCRS
jgi:hypothetical protein